MEELKDGHILTFLRPILPGDLSLKVIAWARDKGLRIANLDTLTPDKMKNMASGERESLGNAIYDAYCHAKGITRVYAPENLLRALDLVGQKFRFDDAKAMREREEQLYSAVKSRLGTFAWRDNYLTRQTLDDKDLAFAVNTWFKGWRENWSEAQKQFFDQCQTEHIKKSWRVYEDGELFETVQDFLRDHAGQEYNYGQVADALQIAKTPAPGAVPQRMKVKDVLEKLSNPKQNIYEDVYKYATRPNVKGKKSATVYVWAPMRRQLERHPGRRTSIIASVIKDFLCAHPDSSQSQIKDAVRAALGQSDNAKVTQVLAEMVASKLVDEPKRGAHNTYMYRVSENPFFAVASSNAEGDKPRAYNPKDIFGVDE